MSLIDAVAPLLEFGLERIGQRQIHVVAAEQQVLSDRNAGDVETAFLGRSA